MATVGFSYYDWVGDFNAVGMPWGERLTYGAGEFDSSGITLILGALPEAPGSVAD